MKIPEKCKGCEREGLPIRMDLANISCFDCEKNNFSGFIKKTKHLRKIKLSR